MYPPTLCTIMMRLVLYHHLILRFPSLRSELPCQYRGIPWWRLCRRNDVAQSVGMVERKEPSFFLNQFSTHEFNKGGNNKGVEQLVDFSSTGGFEHLVYSLKVGGTIYFFLMLEERRNQLFFNSMFLTRCIYLYIHTNYI